MKNNTKTLVECYCKQGLHVGFGREYFITPTDQVVVYQGEFQNGTVHGYGTAYFSPTLYYKGEFQNGKGAGLGEYKYTGGLVYRGDWKNDVKDGFGVWMTKDQESYQGEWVNNKKEGPGIHRKKDGRVFVKWYKADKKTMQQEIFETQEVPVENEDD